MASFTHDGVDRRKAQIATQKRKAPSFARGFSRRSLAARRTVSRVLYRFPKKPATAIHLGLQLPTGSSNQPGSYPNPVTASLFGLAPSEVYLAPHVAIRAVRSYHTISPLPMRRFLDGPAVYFLLHFLSGHPALPLAGTLIHEVLGLSSPAPKRSGDRPSSSRQCKGTGFGRWVTVLPGCHAELDSASLTNGTTLCIRQDHAGLVILSAGFGR